MTRSPNDINYNDLIEQAEYQLNWMRNNNRRLVIEGRMTDHTAQKKIAVQEKIVALLKRYKKDPQANLFESFNNLKK